MLFLLQEIRNLFVLSNEHFDEQAFNAVNLAIDLYLEGHNTEAANLAGLVIMNRRKSGTLSSSHFSRPEA